MNCSICSFEMTGKALSAIAVLWKCPFGHSFIQLAEDAGRRATYPNNLERKALV